ncbi:MAG: aminotransferase class I/II-fold pyridoxal phosphate-dependent enzyme [Clostridia bacterium]|nr:aminotransferase class I/II-fold pyridoxal phosphate-dependent enzyme [Clostridia bacterium]
MEKLALLGGTPVIEKTDEAMFKWPIITQEDEDAALDVIRNNKFSGTDITEKFCDEFAQWQGRKYALAYTNGTMSLAAAMFAIGLTRGDEIICTTKTYWASIVQANNFGAKAVFCNIDDNLSMDPTDLERCITEKTKAIMVVHYASYPCDMDAIMAIAKKHNLLVIEDVSHAQGGMYKGKKVGTFGDVAAMSMMSGKSFAAGELGMLVTDNRKIYERALAYAHHERFDAKHIEECDDLKSLYHIALGGVKGRANQLCSAIARVQLKYYDERCAEINKAMNYFWDLLEGQPGIRPIRTNEAEGSTMAGWYATQGLYVSEELHGLSVERFCEAVREEIDGHCVAGGNFCLHKHNFFREYAETPSDVNDEVLNVSLSKECFSIPWFKHFDKATIEAYAEGYKKVIRNHEALLEGDTKAAQGGRWIGTGAKVRR